LSSSEFVLKYKVHKRVDKLLPRCLFRTMELLLFCFSVNGKSLMEKEFHYSKLQDVTNSYGEGPLYLCKSIFPYHTHAHNTQQTYTHTLQTHIHNLRRMPTSIFAKFKCSLVRENQDDWTHSISCKAMRSENLIEYSIKIRVETIISRIFRTD